MEDFILDACCWHVEAETRENKQRAIAHFRDSYTVLLAFLRGEGLLRDPAFGLRAHWSDFEIRRSDLTNEGYALFQSCHAHWHPAVGEEKGARHLTPWRTRLSKMRGAA